MASFFFSIAISVENERPYSLSFPFPDLLISPLQSETVLSGLVVTDNYLVMALVASASLRNTLRTVLLRQCPSL